MNTGKSPDIYEYGVSSADIVMIQMTDDNSIKMIDEEVLYIRNNTSVDFKLIAVKIDDWNKDLSPWEAPAVFGREGFGGGAADSLNEVLKLCSDKTRTYCIGGYSLAGLFALWAAHKTDIFRGVAAASPSVWFPGFSEFMKENEIKSSAVYLSLGDREDRSKNPVIASVGEKIREVYDLLGRRGTCCTLEWNPGNHFADAALRTAKAFVWLAEHKESL